MKLYGLIGYPLGHSFSERYFREKFEKLGITDCKYRNFELPTIGQLPQMLAENPDLRGFNITIPYKQAILPYLTSLSDEAQAVGAVNCVVITPQGLRGYNTDVYGFGNSLISLIGDARPKALVLGTGGASKAIVYVLRKLGIDYRMVSRQSGATAIGYADVTPELLGEYRLIINTTPVGTFPHADEYPNLPYETLSDRHYLFDLVYNPPVTEFLRRGAERGAKILNGYEMLVGQAEKSWEIWNEAEAQSKS